MTTSKSVSVNIRSTKVKQFDEPKSTSVPIRIKQKTKQKLDQLIARAANKKKLGRKIKSNDIICYALNKVDDADLSKICEDSLSNRERLDLLFEQTKKNNRSLTKEQFYGLLLASKIQTEKI